MHIKHSNWQYISAFCFPLGHTLARTDGCVPLCSQNGIYILKKKCPNENCIRFTVASEVEKRPICCNKKWKRKKEDIHRSLRSTVDALWFPIGLALSGFWSSLQLQYVYYCNVYQPVRCERTLLWVLCCDFSFSPFIMHMKTKKTLCSNLQSL